MHSVNLQKDAESPSPLNEVDYWSDRAADLSSVTTQLSSSRMQLVAQMLQAKGSSYAAALQRWLFWD
jgi:dynein heavy chain